jgi:hypothetical protein
MIVEPPDKSCVRDGNRFFLPPVPQWFPVPRFPMLNAITHLNYLAVLGTALVGFMLGWLWYSPLLFAKAWMAEMKITEATMKAAAEKGMAKYLGKSFLFTLMSTFGSPRTPRRARCAAPGLAHLRRYSFPHHACSMPVSGRTVPRACSPSTSATNSSCSRCKARSWASGGKRRNELPAGRGALLTCSQ